MRYNTANQLDRDRFLAKAQALAGKGAIVELTEKAVRSLSQNAYLHTIIGVVAMDVGVTLDYAKREYFKKLCNGAIFIRSTLDKMQGREVETLRSSAELTKEEMRTAIDRFKAWASENGIYLPEPGDDQRLAEIRCEMERMRVFL